jgi:hypothetical protein
MKLSKYLVAALVGAALLAGCGRSESAPRVALTRQATALRSRTSKATPQTARSNKSTPQTSLAQTPRTIATQRVVHDCDLTIRQQAR